MQKYFKILIKIILYSILIILLIFSTAFFALQTKFVQDFVGKQVIKISSHYFQSNISVKKITYPFFNKINLNDICLYDENKDTLIYSKKIVLNFKYNFTKKEFTISKLQLDSSFINFIIDKNNTLNLEYFLKKLVIKNKKDTIHKITVALNELKILDSRFYLTNLQNLDIKKDSIINFSKLRLNSLNIELRSFHIQDSVGFIIKKLSFIESSGFKLNNLSCIFKVYKSFLKFKDVEISTDYSKIIAEKIYLLFNSFNDFKKNELYDNVKFSIIINSGAINFSDLSYFVKFFKNSNQKINFSGNFFGPLSKLKGSNVILSTGKYTKANISFSINGLPNIDELYTFLDVKNLITNFNDIVTFDFPGKKIIKIPVFIKEAGNINLKGQFTGFYNDFVAYGVLKSNYGIIKTDMLLKPKGKEEIYFNGILQTENYDIGKLFGNKELGKITFEINTNGYSKNYKTLNASIDGNIKFLEYKNYIYKNISLRGLVNNKIFSGKIAIHDDNIDFIVQGILNFNKTRFNYELQADVNYLNLFNLNIDKKEKNQIVSFKFKSVLEGNSFSTLNGYLTIYDFKATKPSNSLLIDDVTLKIYNNDVNSINLDSDFINASVVGKYNMEEIGKNFLKFFRVYIPSLFSKNDNKNLEDKISQCNFNFNIDILDLQTVFDYFNKDIFISSGIKLKGEFSSSDNKLSAYFLIPSIGLGNKFIKNIDLELYNSNDTLKYDSHVDRLLFSKDMFIENIDFSGNIFNDSLIALIKWNNLKGIYERGYIPFVASIIEENNEKQKFLIGINLMTSYLSINENLWNISSAKFLIGQNYFSVSNFILNYNNQLIKADGLIENEEKNNIVEIDVRNFDVKNLWNLISYTREFDGIINGDLSFTGTLSNPILNAKIEVDSLFYKEEKLGKLEVLSSWNNETKELSFKSSLERGTLKSIKLDGKMYPEENGKLDVEVLLDKLRVETFVPENNIFNNPKGFVSGQIRVRGDLKKPVINGDLFCQRIVFEILPLKTKCTFTDNLRIKDNRLNFENFSFFDKDGNTGKLNGYIDFNNLNNLAIELSFDVSNFNVMNTTYQDNPSFFGEIYATGVATIQGSQKDLNIDVKARTETNSKFYIYLEDKENLSGYDFVTFIRKGLQDNIEKSLEEKYRKVGGGLDINIDADITPEAEIQIVFNPLTGDVIKGRGNGNLNIQSHKEKFNIYGLYNIESGEYSFNLMNVINRKFVLKEGSTIFFNGNPLDATLNIIAYYRTKASLGELFGNVEEVQQKTTVDCQIIMTGKLSQPNIRYDIYLPNVEESTRDNVKSKINTNEELIKQFTSLLVLNRFIPSITSTSDNNTFTSYAYTAGINPGDLITSQLSNWLSQLNEDFNIGVNLRSNKQLRTEEIELMLSTQLLNDRLTIQGNVDVPTNAAARASNRIVGDVEIEYKINKTGKLRAKAFNRSNEDQLNILSPYTQGIGIVCREEFDSPIELFKRIFKKNKINKKINQN